MNKKSKKMFRFLLTDRLVYFVVLLYMAGVGLYGYYVMTPPKVASAQCRNLIIAAGTANPPAANCTNVAHSGHNYNSSVRRYSCLRVF